MKMIRLVVAGLFIISPFAVQADFIGVYDVSTWTTGCAAATTNTTEVGMVGTCSPVDTSGAPSSIVMTEPDNGGGWNYEVQFLNTAAADGTISFDWSIGGIDLFAGSANFYIGDTTAAGFDFWATDFSDVLWSYYTSPSTSGTFTGSILAGQAFGFGVATADDCCGSITLTISDFSAPVSVPEPGTLALFGMGLLGMAASRRRKKV